MNDIKIFLIEDDISALKTLTELLQLDNFNVIPFSNPISAINEIFIQEPEIIISDIKMPELNGLQLLEKVKEKKLDSEVILMTAFGDINTAIDAIKKGAYHYLVKPINYEELQNILKKICEIKNLKNFITLSNKNKVEIVAESPKMKKVLKLVREVASTDTTVLIEGETGTGKELVARMLHIESKRKDFPFVPVNCAALPKDLLEAELFGFEKGSFTGALTSRKGKFMLADKGTIFLDEISEMDYDLQAKLLRVLEDGVVEKIGSDKQYLADIRIIAATNKNLKNAVENGLFRKDLFFRINVVKIEIPPLRERKEDILPLTKVFLKEMNSKYDKNITEIDEEAIQKLQSYNFPGNIRELKHIIERAVITSSGNILKEKDILLTGFEEKIEGILIPFDFSLKEAEDKIILENLKKENYNKKKVAEKLGISVRKIELKFKEWGVSLKELKKYN